MVHVPIRNAAASGKNSRKSKRKVSPLSKPTGDTGNKAVRHLQGRTSGDEQESKTIEVIDGVPHFSLVIPCERGRPDRIKPLLLVEENEFGGPKRGVYQCEQCTKIYHTRKAWAKHAGMVSNVMGSCTGE